MGDDGSMWVTAKDLWSRVRLKTDEFGINDHHIDEVIGPVLNSGGLIEIFGPSGSGKSTFAMQILTTCLSQHLDFKALYICTDSAFCVERLAQIYSSINDAVEEDFTKFSSRIIVQHLGDVETQEHFICYFLAPLVEQQKIKIIIIDSISANFRACVRDQDSTMSLYSMSHTLSSVTSKFETCTICINQITGIIGMDSSSSSINFRPALGLSWSNCVSSRIMIEKIDSSSGDQARRLVSIIRCPLTPPITICCRLVHSGFSFLAPSPTCNYQ